MSSAPSPGFGDGDVIVDPGPRPPTENPTGMPSLHPTRSPVVFGSGGIDTGPRPPTPMPSISAAPSSAPTDTPVPTTIITSFPTPPTDSFPYRAEGASSFGHRYADWYYDAYQHSFRRSPGWSFGQGGGGVPLGLGPFCFRNTCYIVTKVCEQFQGIALHETVCSFPSNVIVAGPSCWRNECIANGTKACDQVGGVTVGVTDGIDGPQWCVFSGAHSLVGPACYNDECDGQALAEACLAGGGVVWNKNYCILEGYYTTIGPVCWNGYCQEWETQTKCENDLNGIVFANKWCVIPGCDKTVIGPMCSMVPTSLADQCFTAETVRVCNAAGGINIGNRFCILEGTDWTLIGPTAYYKNETLTATSLFCSELQQIPPEEEEEEEEGEESQAQEALAEDYFTTLETYDIAGRFCLVHNHMPTTTPFCGGSSITPGVPTGCDYEMGRTFCQRFGGKALDNGFMCSLCDSFRQVVGPLVWNGDLLPGNPDYCEGPFCAIPNLDIVNGTNLNLRCPSATIPVLNRCELFGGAIGTGLVNNNTNRDGDDGDNNETTPDDAQKPTSSAFSFRVGQQPADHQRRLATTTTSGLFTALLVWLMVGWTIRC